MALGPTLPTTLLMSTGVSVRRIEGPASEVEHSTPFSAEVKNEWSCTSLPTVCLYGGNRNNLTLNVYGCTAAETKMCPL
jgi:hypothetical protein